MYMGKGTMTIFSVLFFLLLGFVIGFIFACSLTLGALESCAKNNKPFIGHWRIIEIPETERNSE